MTTALAIPSSRELEALTPRDRWQLEVALTEIQPQLREINDAELHRWVEIEGKTQTEIAELVGLDQSRISRRCAALGIRPDKGEGTRGGRPEVMRPHNPDEPAELVEGEVVPPPKPPRNGSAPDGPAHHFPDVVAADAEENLRTQALHWFEQGAHIKGLLDKRRPLEARSADDRKAIKREAAAMERTARRLKEAVDA